MAIKDIFKVNRKTFIDPSAWVGYTGVKGSIQTTWELMKGLFIVAEPTRQETFEEALVRLNVTEEALKERGKQYFLVAMVFFVLAVFSILFAFYLLFVDRTFAGCLLGLAVAVLLLSQAFRYHFWYFQIKVRKLGCTFDEWKDSFLKPSQGPKT